jgi:hypothetical protein
MDRTETKYPRYTNLDGYIFFAGKGLWGSQYSEEDPEDYWPSFCNNRDCPFFVIGVGEPDLCDFDPERVRCNGSPDDADICEAVAVHHCTRPEVLETYNQYYSPKTGSNDKGDDEA